MAGVLQHLRSSTLDKRPNPASMVDGQVAINYASGAPGMFFKDSNGSLVKVGPVHVGTTAPNVSPASGGTAGNSRGEQWLDTTGGTYVFKIWDGSAWRSESGTFVDTSGDTMTGALGIIAGSASTPGLFFSGDTNTGIYSPGADQLAISTGGSGRLFVDSSGRVSVGTSAPAARLQVNQNTDSATALAVVSTSANTGITSDYASLYLQNTDTTNNNYNTIGFINDQGGYSAGIHGIYTSHTLGSQSGVIAFATSNAGSYSEKFRITSAGLVGVGTSSPSNTLHVAGTGRFINGANPLIIATDSGDPYIYTESAAGLKLGTNSTVRMTINSSGSVGVGTTSPGNLLHVSGTGTVCQLASSNNNNLINLKGNGATNGVWLGTTSSDDFIISSGASVTERARIDSSGRLGIGNSIPGSFDSSANQLVVGSGSGNQGLTLYAGNTSNSNIYFADGTAGSAPYIGFVQYRHSDNRLDFGTNDGTRMSIDSSGRVGIGSTAPSNVCEILESGTGSGIGGLTVSTASTGGNPGVIFRTSTSNRFSISLTGSAGSESLRFYDVNNSAERARIDSSGRLLVGTSSQQGDHYLQVQGSATASSYPGSIFLRRGLANASIGSGNQLGVIDFGNQDGGKGATISAEGDAQWGTDDYPARLLFSVTADGASSPTERMRINNAGTHSFFCTDTTAGIMATSAAPSTGIITFACRHSASSTTTGTNAMYVYSNGNLANTNNSYGAISDIKLKENIVDANSQWDDLKALQVRNYNFKEGQTHTQIGLVAQEAELVSPGLVYESPDRDAEGNDLGTTTKSVNYSVLYMKAVKALQEAMDRIETLEQRLNDAGIN